MRLIALLVLFLYASFAYADSIPIQQVMTQDELSKIGLDTATPEQKQEFENWLAHWTHQVLEQAPTYRPGTNLSLWVQSWPSYANPTKTKLSAQELDEKMKANQRIDKIRNDGAIIELQDGSVWAVSPIYANLSKDWLRNQVIEIAPSDDIRFTYKLFNVNASQVVYANMSQGPSPTGKKAPENPAQFKGAVQLQNVSTDGTEVLLGNGTKWNIAPIDIYKARTWQPYDRIKVEKADNFLYQYRLTNLDTGQMALANPAQ